MIKEAIEFCFEHWVKTGLFILWIGVCLPGSKIISVTKKDS